MPKDVDIAKDLKRLLSESTYSKSALFEYKFDQYIEGERVDDIIVRVSVESDSRSRLTRKDWSRNAVISVAMLAPQQENSDQITDADCEIEALLEFWDEVQDFIQTALPAGSPAVAIGNLNDERFDKKKLSDDRQFRAAIAVSYKLI